MAQGSDGHRNLKLTLRTLLAWMDDALPPEEARNIGQRVNESPVARELIARIQKTTRRRRLTVPPSTGPEGIDPNLVSGYLDNELSPEAVAEYEERCLRSEVNLAEVASCHQILSMLGQKAKVPGEARFRMYRLVKGRESAPQVAAKDRNLPPPEPVAAPIPPWQSLEPLPGSGWRRYWPVATAAGLFLMLLGSALMLARPDRGARTQSGPMLAANRPDADRVKREARAEVRPPAGVGVAEQAALAEEKANVETEPAKPAAEPAPEEKAAPARFRVADHEGLILLRDPRSGEWTELTRGAEVAPDSLILGLAPYRTGLRLGDVELDLVGPAEVRVLEPEDGEAARFGLEQGRLVVHGGTTAATVAVLIGDKAIDVTPPIGQPVGLVRIDIRPPGEPQPTGSALVVHALHGDVVLGLGNEKRTLAGPGTTTIQPPDSFGNVTSDAPPSWVSDEAPSEVDVLLGREFLALFEGSRVNRALAEAIVSDKPEVRELAVSAAAALGNIGLVIPLLVQEDETPAIRGSVIQALREYGARSVTTAENLRTELAKFGEEWAQTVEKLLAGFTVAEAEDEATYVRLVKLLEHTDIGVRTLALEQLMTLTGNDSLEYDPAQPTKPPGLEAWQSLLRQNELKPLAPAPAGRRR